MTPLRTEEHSVEPAVLADRSDGILTLTLNRDEYRNALSAEIIDGLTSQIEEAVLGEQTRVIVIAAHGKAFCAGAKLDQMSEQSDAMSARRFHARGRKLFAALLECPLPTIAKVQGHALAGGCGLATACDFVVCAEGVTFGYPEIDVAASPSIVMQILLRRVPWRIGMEWAMRGQRVDAAVAERWGLINRVVEREALDAEVAKLAAELASKDAGAMSVIKALGIVSPDMALHPSLMYATEMSAIASSSEASRAAIADFFEKRRTPAPSS
jgi:methylglutaconyl-CoA hydratase